MGESPAAGQRGCVRSSGTTSMKKRYAYRFQYQFVRARHHAVEVALDAISVAEPSLSWFLPQLQAKSVSCVYLCGMPVEHTVREAAIQALQAGMAVFIIADACAAADLQKADTAREELSKMGVSFIEST